MAVPRDEQGQKPWLSKWCQAIKFSEDAFPYTWLNDLIGIDRYTNYVCRFKSLSGDCISSLIWIHVRHRHVIFLHLGCSCVRENKNICEISPSASKKAGWPTESQGRAGTKHLTAAVCLSGIGVAWVLLLHVRAKAISLFIFSIPRLVYFDWNLSSAASVGPEAMRSSSIVLPFNLARCTRLCPSRSRRVFLNSAPSNSIFKA